MSDDSRQRLEWRFGGRYYTVTPFSDVATRDGFGFELEDIGPAPSRGLVLEAFWDDSTSEFTFTAHTQEPLSFGLVEKFIAEARRGVPPTRQGTP